MPCHLFDIYYIRKKSGEWNLQGMFNTLFCTIAYPTMSFFLLTSFLNGFDVSFGTICKIILLEYSTGTRKLKVTLQDHETLLSGVVGSELRISG